MKGEEERQLPPSDGDLTSEVRFPIMLVLWNLLASILDLMETFWRSQHKPYGTILALRYSIQHMMEHDPRDIPANPKIWSPDLNRLAQQSCPDSATCTMGQASSMLLK